MEGHKRLFIVALLLLAALVVPLGCEKGPTAPNGLSLSTVEGYQNWPLISISYRRDLQELHIILGNTTALEDFLNGIPDNGHPFTDGAILVRLIYSVQANPYFGKDLEPGDFKGLDFMVKDAERFKTTRGWGYASFAYDGKKKAFKPFSTDALSLEKCVECHRLVEKRDYVFTSYTPTSFR